MKQGVTRRDSQPLPPPQKSRRGKKKRKKKKEKEEEKARENDGENNPVDDLEIEMTTINPVAVALRDTAFQVTPASKPTESHVPSVSQWIDEHKQMPTMVILARRTLAVIFFASCACLSGLIFVLAHATSMRTGYAIQSSW